MINILNDLKESCEDCPYMVLTHCESLGSGRLAYTCKYKRICEHCVEKITEIMKKESEVRNDKRESLNIGTKDS